MRLVLLCALAVSSNAVALTCRVPACSCLPSEFTGFVVLESNGRYTFSDLRWSDGGTAVIDPTEVFEQEPRATQLVPPGQRFLVGGRATFEDAGARASIEMNAYLLGDGGSIATCGVNVAPTDTWRAALVQGTCAALAPQSPCGNGPPRGCSTTGGFALAAAAVLAVRRLLTRR
ncbi:MAG: hypothetical protein GQE15_35055 [Archangiaceae bacterium]|nr:hypothetical protein [Archangiaceae bacterium]